LLTGNLVKLKPVTKEDLKRVNEWNNDEELTFLGSGTDSALQNNNPLEKLEAHYENNLTNHHLWEHGRVFSVYTLASDTHIGKCDYRDINPITRAATIGLAIGDRSFWGKGYGPDIVHALTRHLFNTLNLERIQVDTWSGNTQAVRCYEKVGFQVEGRLRNNEFVNGSYYDTIIMGLLRSDYSRS
jgi:RimJ/RimL family protein N-acetyltransferase